MVTASPRGGVGSNRRRTSSPQYRLTSVSHRKLDSACCRGEPARKWRNPRRTVREDTAHRQRCVRR